MNPTLFQAEATFERLLDAAAALLRAPQGMGVEYPDDDLHREILLPLLPAMLGDGAIRKHWQDQTATGFLARLKRHVQGGEAAPRWSADDFEIHVTASYAAGADAKALADTLLSEDSLRGMAAALMNQLLDAVWAGLMQPVAVERKVAVPTTIEPAVIPEAPISPVHERHAVGFAHRLPRVVRPNPIRGTRTSHGGLGAPDWTAGYPLR